MLQKIINLTSRQNGNDVVRLSRWLRCLFNLMLPLDEKISLKCLDQVTQIAVKKQGVCHVSQFHFYRCLSTSSARIEPPLRCRSWRLLLYQVL